MKKGTFTNSFVILFVLIVQVFSTQSLQAQQNLYGTAATDQHFTHVFPDGQDYYILGQDGFEATITRVLSTGAWDWTQKLNMPSGLLDAIVMPNGNLLFVGFTLQFPNQSIIGEIQRDKTLRCLNIFDSPGTEGMARIDAINATTYLAVGFHTANTPQDIVIYKISTANPGCAILEKYQFSNSPGADYGHDIVVTGPNSFMVCGNDANNNAVIYHYDLIGGQLGGVVEPAQYEYVDMEPVAGDLLAAANSLIGGRPYIVRFDSDLLPIWEAEIFGLTSVNQILIDGNDKIYVVGTANNINRTVVLKLDDCSGTCPPSSDWFGGMARYLDNGSTYHSGGYLAIANNGLVFADGREGPGGIGMEDGFLSRTDDDMTSMECMLEHQIDLVLLSTFFASPEGDSLFFYDIPLPVEREVIMQMWDYIGTCESEPVDSCVCDTPEIRLSHNGTDYFLSCLPHGVPTPVLTCPIGQVNISSVFGCVNSSNGELCETESEVIWTLTGPSSTTPIDGGTAGHFSVFFFPPAYFQTNGTYFLTLSTLCPGQQDSCVCVLDWIVECDTCCTDELAFLAAAQAVNPFGTLGNCAISFQADGLTDCMQITYDWGDGNGDGPFAGNNIPVTHTYAASGDYVVCYTIEEVANGEVCWDYIHCDTVQVICDSCCTDFTLFCDNVMGAVNVTVDELLCKENFSIDGLLDCESITLINWGDSRLDLGPFINGNTVMHSYALNGTYTIMYTAVQIDPITGETCFEKTFEIPITVDCDSLCIPGVQDSICDDPIDILFVLDNSGSIDPNEFLNMKNMISSAISQIEASYSNALYGVVHYGGDCGDRVYVEHDFTPASTVSSIQRRFPPGIMDDLNKALGTVISALSATADFDLLPTPTSFLSRRAGSNLAILIFTDGWPGVSIACSNSTLLPYTNSVNLKATHNAKITVVHLEPAFGGVDPVCAAIASPGGTYVGPVGVNNYDDPATTSIAGPRQYIPWNFWSPSFNIISSIPPCDSIDIDCCDSLEIISSHSTTGGMCCTDITLKNKVGFPVYKLEAEIISSPGWVFNAGSIAYSAGFNWAVFPTGQKLSLGHSSGQIPTGTHTNALSYCLASTSATPSATQTIVIKWYGLLPGDSVATVVCTDTLTTECPKNTGNNCISIVSSTVNCNPDNPYEYFVNFTVQNLSGTPITQVVLQNLPPGFGFSFCNASTPVTSIALPVSPNPLLSGGISSNLCVKIISPIPILTPQQVCFRLGVVGDSLCCHSTELSCVTLQPCCDPCDMVSATYEEIPGAEDGCCYKLDLHRECEYQLFSRVETEILTPGVIFGYHALGGPDASGWTVLPGATPHQISYAPLLGFINKDKVDDIIQFCLDDINSPAEIPQVVVVRWYSNLYSPERLMCTDTLEFECDADIQCVWVDSKIECLPDSNKYMLTMTVTNHSTIPFNATDFHVSVVSPTDLILTPTGGIFPLIPSLPANNSVTISTCIESASGSFPSSSNYIVLSYRLGFYNGSSFDTCCFENRLDTILLPSCDTCTCPGSDLTGPNLIKNGDFSQGDNFFTSDLTGGSCTCTEGTYCVSDNFQDKCSGWPFLEDHTAMNATGSFLIVDGTQTPASNIWSQQVNVIPGMTYCFSFWTANAYPDTLQNFLLDVSIVGNGVSLNIGTAQVSQTTPPWENHTFTWTCPLPFAPPYIIEINQTTGSQYNDFGIDDICLTKIQPIDTCECGLLQWAEVYGISSLPQPAQCDEDFIIIPCVKQGPEFFIHGDFPCLTNECATQDVAWTLHRPGTLSSVSGVYSFSGSYPHFDIGIPWSDFSTPGVYSLTLTRLCGTKMCSCTFNIIVESCPCSCNQLEDDVEKGFTVTGSKASCKRKFKPVQLCLDDIVNWTVTGPGVNVSYAPISATSTLSVSFPPPGGSYNVCMVVERIDPFTLDTCIREYCRSVIVKCKPKFPEDTIPSITHCPGGNRVWNGDFDEGIVWGHMANGGAVLHWDPFDNVGNGIALVTKEGASDDGHVVLIGGKDNFAGIYQEVNLTGDSVFIGFYAINYLGSDSPSGTALEFRLHSEPIQGPHIIIWRYVMDTSSINWVDTSIVLPIDIDPSLQYLVVCVQNDDETMKSVVGIDNIEICTDEAVGISDPGRVQEIRIYPNPNTGEFTVDFLEPAPIGSSIRIINLAGQVLSEEKIENASSAQEVDVTMLPQGMYFIQILSKGQVIAVNKFVKQ